MAGSMAGGLINNAVGWAIGKPAALVGAVRHAVAAAEKQPGGMFAVRDILYPKAWWHSLAANLQQPQPQLPATAATKAELISYLQPGMDEWVGVPIVTGLKCLGMSVGGGVIGGAIVGGLVAGLCGAVVSR